MTRSLTSFSNLHCPTATLNFIALALAVMGCSGSSGLAPVTGKVTYLGQPVAGATILFMGDGAVRPATAVSASDGAYSLRTQDASGAAPGPYTVVVSKNEVPLDAAEPPSMEEAAKQAKRPPPAPKRLVPAKYEDVASSPLKFEVKTGRKNVFDIQLAD